MRIGVLTGGGDCPGLNAVIRAAVRKGTKEYGHEFVGFRYGWRGPIEGITQPLDWDTVENILDQGGTILHSSRTNPYKIEGGVEAIKKNMAALGVDALIAIGGEDTLGVATKLTADGVNCVGVPKTIDNDLSGTDYTFGFDTAVNIATEAIDRLWTTADSHDRCIVVEIMGRHAGWMTLHAGMAGGANVVLIPEVAFDIEKVANFVKERKDAGKATIVAVSEGAHAETGMVLKDGEVDAFGHVKLGGVGDWVAKEIKERAEIETRAIILGHLQRGGTPTAFDRVLATRLGLEAAAAVNEGDFGKMMALQGTNVVRIPIHEGTDELKTVPVERYADAEIFFGV
ncbi:6-phosphofructokinase [Glycomyces sp. TRM65418]|uniref:6-phosphofructokinase n=1 Tax=Glycomyces sp. TRM65418 TaxID=2867006 RepID=UPI001CE62890|nr:6-phosphofructokinase [Glycomyces sp. TRM65418]MCC3762098.1 6-phosphofructokinase [Glycomyces sp. TRM65418]QZD56165.1 6-phosphofructokinase [Glycomyces sp. TRM65418]